MMMSTQGPIYENKAEAIEQGLNRCTTC